MRKYNFKPAEKYAVWHAYNKCCHICEEPITFKALTIDHIIPESLENSDDLIQLLNYYNLPENYKINSFQNWAPSCAKCNGRKSVKVLNKSPGLLFLFDRAKKRGEDARKFHERFNKKASEAKFK